MSRADGDIPSHRIAEWRAHLRNHGLGDGDRERLERTLREQVSGLVTAGLDPDEAFLIAVKRTAGLGTAAREFSQAYGERLWRQIVTRPAAGIGQLPLRNDLVLAAVLALAAAAAVKVPALFGVPFDPAPGGFYARNLGLLVLSPLAALLLGRHGTNLARAVTVGVLFAAGAVFANAFPFNAGGGTEILTAICRSHCGWPSALPTPVVAGGPLRGACGSCASPASGSSTTF